MGPISLLRISEKKTRTFLLIYTRKLFSFFTRKQYLIKALIVEMLQRHKNVIITEGLNLCDTSEIDLMFI